MLFVDGPEGNEKVGALVTLLGATIALLLLALFFPNTNGDATAGATVLLAVEVFVLLVVPEFPNTNGDAPAGGRPVLTVALELSLFTFPNTNVGALLVRGAVLVVEEVDGAAAPITNGVLARVGIGNDASDEEISNFVVCPGLIPKLNSLLGALVDDENVFDEEFGN